MDGTDVYVLDTVIEGKNKTDLNYTDNKDIYEDMIPNLVENPICMDTQEALLSIGKDFFCDSTFYFKQNSMATVRPVGYLAEAIVDKDSEIIKW